MLYQQKKRIFDILAASTILLAILPLLFVIGLLVRIFIGSPILFRQSRPGMDEKIFKLYKFRTMRNLKDKKGNLLSDEKRLTRFGRLLRSLSLDELPELINVLKGEMSLVGPRPLLIEYLPHYTSEQRVRHHVKPGITGWAQINGRNSLSWQQKFELDIWYVKHACLALDIKIIFLTFMKVIKREGISAKHHATMPRFDSEAYKK